MEYLKISYCKSDLPWFSYAYRKCKSVEFSTGYIGSPNCVDYLNVEQLLIFEDAVRSLLNVCFYDVCSLIRTEPNRTPITCSCLIKKRSHIRPVYLMGGWGGG